MGKNSNMMNHYFGDSRRFADLFNAVFFQGDAVVREEELSEGSEVYHPQKTAGTGAGRPKHRGERSRDVCKKLENGGILRILALENQNQIDYAMPYRCMQYDTMEYGKQLEKIRRDNLQKGSFTTAAERLCGLIKSDRLMPVYTLCLYHGEEKWDGPRSLREMMQFTGVEDRFQELFIDYPLRLYCLNEANDLGLFRTEVQQLFRALQYRKDRKGLTKLLKGDPAFRQLDKETLETVAVLLDMPEVWEHRDKIENRNSEKEEYDMCQAVMEWRVELVKSGRGECLIEQVKKKLQKGKDIETIVEELEEPRENVEHIIAAIEKYGMEESASEIYEQMTGISV